MICRERAEQVRWEVIDVYTAYAICGTGGISKAQRPGMGAMLAQVAAGRIDQFLVEETDRIVRHQGNSLNPYEQLRFHGTRLFTPSAGMINETSATFKGLMDAKIRRPLSSAFTTSSERLALALVRSPRD